MKGQAGKSLRTGLVMECTDFTVLVFLLMVACGTVVVVAQRRQDLNGHCQIVNECNPVGYFCARNRTCQCKPGYTPDEDWRRCVGFVGSKCIYDSHCIEGAYCTGAEGLERCKCREQENYFPDEDGQTCTNSAVKPAFRGLAFFTLLAVFWTNSYFNT